MLVDAVAPRPVDKATGDAGRLPALADFIAGLKRRGPDAVGSHLIQVQLYITYLPSSLRCGKCRFVSPYYLAK